MGRSQESFNKKEVRNKKEKKRKEKEQKRIERKTNAKEGKGLDDMIAWVDENGVITSERPENFGKREEVKLEDIVIGTPRRSEEDKPDPVRKGVVSFFNESKGFGFIRDLENQQSVFVHVNNIEESISENSRVTFEVEQGHKGPSAIKVKIDK